MHTLRLLLAGLLLAVTVSAATTWHVSDAGDDAHDGATPATAFRTLQKAADTARPGDTVLVGDGIYTDPVPESGQAVLTINHRGSPEAWTTFKAAPGARPEIRPTAWHGIFIGSGTHIVIDGFHVTGINDSLALIDAFVDGTIKERNGKTYWGNPRFNTNGISIDGRKSPVDQKPHHVIVRNCTVSKLPGGGITAIEFDHLLVEDNVIFDNCWYMRFAGSGITTLNNWAADDAPGYHVVIQRNLVWNNKTLVPWISIGKLSDGNGILLDVTDKNRSGGAANPTGIVAASDPNAGALKPERPLWTHRALVANNVSAFNGGSGIHTFRTAHVDIVNNTTYWNGSVVNYQELFPNRSDDIVFLNNIAVPRPGGKVTSDNRNTNIRWENNLYPVSQDHFTGPGNLVAEPLFKKIARDLREADFRLAPGSPGLDSGTPELLQPSDLTGAPRPAGLGVDRGAYEQ